MNNRDIFHHQYDVWMCLKMEDATQNGNSAGNDDDDDDDDGDDDDDDDDVNVDVDGFFWLRLDELTFPIFQYSVFLETHTRSKEEQLHGYGVS